jgi:hypothetical protein
MFLEFWMIAAVILVTGLWAEYRYRRGVLAGTEVTVVVLLEKKMIKIDSNGQMVRHPHA